MEKLNRKHDGKEKISQKHLCIHTYQKLKKSEKQVKKESTTKTQRSQTQKHYSFSEIQYVCIYIYISEEVEREVRETVKKETITRIQTPN